MVPGTPVRIIRQPYFGAIGNVFNLPLELQQVDSESYVRVPDVELGNARAHGSSPARDRRESALVKK